MMPMHRDRWKHLVVAATLTGIACAVFTAALTATTRIAFAQGGGRPCFATMGVDPGKVSNYMPYTSNGGPTAPNGPGYYASFDSTLTYTCDSNGVDPSYCGACDVTSVTKNVNGQKVTYPPLSVSNQGTCNTTNTFTTTTRVGPIPKGSYMTAVSVLTLFGSIGSCANSNLSQQYDSSDFINP